MLSVEYQIVFAFSSQADRSWVSVVCCGVGLMGPEEIAGVQLMCWALSRKGTKPLQVRRPGVYAISHLVEAFPQPQPLAKEGYPCPESGGGG